MIIGTIKDGALYLTEEEGKRYDKAIEQENRPENFYHKTQLVHEIDIFLGPIYRNNIKVQEARP